MSADQRPAVCFPVRYAGRLRPRHAHLLPAYSRGQLLAFGFAALACSWLGYLGAFAVQQGCLSEQKLCFGKISLFSGSFITHFAPNVVTSAQGMSIPVFTLAGLQLGDCEKWLAGRCVHIWMAE
ncbi:G-protein coupled receptor 78 [Camelus dromedarius]|uniref:G-protein coupled receptor 78 n=1 Tax=Camelus dromedarius TaxID=9838 RepID=A0A5N4EI07_CAMDR|nr:G-protein coupled receptor 78 [Camelus dromedarius]